jgi:hypothetical protein
MHPVNVCKRLHTNFTERSLNVDKTFTKRSLNVYKTFIKRLQNVSLKVTQRSTIHRVVSLLGYTRLQRFIYYYNLQNAFIFLFSFIANSFRSVRLLISKVANIFESQDYKINFKTWNKIK